MLSAGLTLTHDDNLDLMAFLRALTASPAQILGIDSGYIAEGATADLILIDPNRPWLVETIINGEIVFDLDG